MICEHKNKTKTLYVPKNNNSMVLGIPAPFPTHPPSHRRTEANSAWGLVQNIENIGFIGFLVFFFGWGAFLFWFGGFSFLVLGHSFFVFGSCPFFVFLAFLVFDFAFQPRVV